MYCLIKQQLHVTGSIQIINESQSCLIPFVLSCISFDLHCVKFKGNTNAHVLGWSRRCPRHPQLRYDKKASFFRV